MFIIGCPPSDGDGNGDGGGNGNGEVIDNSNFYGTYSVTLAVGNCDPDEFPLTIGNDESLRDAEGYIYVPQTESSYTTNEGTITGINGLILGLAKTRGMNGLCLLGETSGYIVDAKAAQIILEVFKRIVNIPIDLSMLQERAKEVEAVLLAIGQAQKTHKKESEKTRLEYIS